MPSNPKEAQDIVRGINITFVDLIGALLPGLVWFVLLATIVSLARSPSGGASPFKTVHEIFQYGSETGGAVYAAVAFLAILVGWVIKVAGLDLADSLCACSIWLAHPSNNIADFQFPYNWIVKNKHSEVFESVTEIATAQLGQPSPKAPRRQPFDTCKLVVRQSDPLCREELERAEAQVALLGSLFLASLLSFASAVVALRHSPWEWEWIAGSAAAVVFLGYSFHKDRRAEVDRTYLMALLVADREREKSSNASAAGAAAGSASTEPVVV